MSATEQISKFQRYRKSRQDSGLKLLRVWVPDPRSADFAGEALRQGMLLRGAPEELEALDFIEQAMGWPNA